MEAKSKEGVASSVVKNIVSIDEGKIQSHVTGIVRSTVEETLNGLLEAEADRCLGLVESLSDFYPKTDHQRCTVHFYRNVFPVVPRNRMKEVSNMLKAIHVQEDRAAALEKIDAVAAKLLVMKLLKASEKVKNKAHETLSYYAFPTNPQVQQQQT